MFALWDVDGDGMISEHDVASVLRLMGSGPSSTLLSDDEITLLAARTIAAADCDGDGIVSFHDMQQSLCLFDIDGALQVPVVQEDDLVDRYAAGLVAALPSTRSATEGNAQFKLSHPPCGGGTVQKGIVSVGGNATMPSFSAPPSAATSEGAATNTQPDRGAQGQDRTAIDSGEGAAGSSERLPPPQPKLDLQTRGNSILLPAL